MFHYMFKAEFVTLVGLKKSRRAYTCNADHIPAAMRANPAAALTAVGATNAQASPPSSGLRKQNPERGSPSSWRKIRAELVSNSGSSHATRWNQHDNLCGVFLCPYIRDFFSS